MAIRINLLAEAQALEEERRKDPVKRAILVAGVIVLLAGFWVATRQVRNVFAGRELTLLASRWKSLQKNYEGAVESQRQALEAEQKLVALNRLATNRFLWGNALNALQQTMTQVDEIQVTRLKVEQSYSPVEGVPAKTNAGAVVPGRPAGAAERIVMIIDGMDTSAPAGSQVSRFKEAITKNAYFQEWLHKTNGVMLDSLSPPQVSPARKGQYVTFSLKCNFPEKVR